PFEDRKVRLDLRKSALVPGQFFRCSTGLIIGRTCSDKRVVGFREHYGHVASSLPGRLGFGVPSATARLFTRSPWPAAVPPRSDGRSPITARARRRCADRGSERGRRGPAFLTS